MVDTPTAVSDGVAAYGTAETSLSAAHDALLLLPATYAALYANGVIGYLESVERSSKARSLAGEVMDVLNHVLLNHQADTGRATTLGIDIPAPTGPGVHPDGGGR